MPNPQLAALAAALAAALTIAPAQAQSYPTKPVRLVIPFNPGGTIDPITRLLADVMSRNMGQHVVVENRSGANGNVGTAEVVKGAPDGYTIGMATSGTLATNPHLYGAKMPFNPKTELTMIGLFANVPNILVVNPGVQARTLKDFTDYVKKNPGRLNFGSTGNGSSMHLAGELYKTKTGTFMVHIPYNSPALATQDLLGGNTQVMFQLITGVVGHVRKGTLRAIGVLAPKRSVALPDVPTMAEQGLPIEGSAWFVLVGPAGLAAAPLAKLNAELNAALKDATLLERLKGLGAEVMGGSQKEAVDYLNSEYQKWGEVVRASDAKID